MNFAQAKREVKKAFGEHGFIKRDRKAVVGSQCQVYVLRDGENFLIGKGATYQAAVKMALRAAVPVRVSDE